MPEAAYAPRRDHAVDGRDETPNERADRNWSELLQELRVLQTGSQILTGFLLAVAFQPAFADLTSGQKVFYLVLVVLAAMSGILALAPVALHRLLFRQRAKPETVSFGHAALLTALVAVSLLLVGVVGFIFAVVVGDAASWTAGVVLTAVIVAFWVVGPLAIRARGRSSRSS